MEYRGFIRIIDIPKISLRGMELNEKNIHFKYAFSFDVKKASAFAMYFKKYNPNFN